MSDYITLQQLKETRDIQRLHTTLIIVPFSLINQWQITLDMVDTMSYEYMCINTQKQLHKLDISNPPRIVLISNTMYRKMEELIIKKELNKELNNIIWNRVIIDEPHTFTLTNMPEAEFTWLICRNTG